MKREVNMRIDTKKNTIKNKNREEEKRDSIITDPFGSWTGVNVDDCYEKPVQDADDL